MRGANLLRANLREADLRGADLLDTNMRDADLTGCKAGQLPGTALMTLLKQAIE
ncbi:MAG: pentapeptide repeat-containing protein [Kiloniellaceae bacterium]